MPIENIKKKQGEFGYARILLIAVEANIKIL